MRIEGRRIIHVEPINPSDDYDPDAYRRLADAAVRLSVELAIFGDVLLAPVRDEAPGMTLDELLPEIDSFLAEYRSET